MCIRDSNKTYYFSGAEPGEYSIQVLADGYISQFYENVYDIGETRNVKYIEITEAETTTVELQLTEAGTVSGKITDSNDKVIIFPDYNFLITRNNLYFYIIDAESGLRKRYVVLRDYNYLTGEYYLKNIPEGKYKLLLEIRTYLDDPFYYFSPEFYTSSGNAFILSNGEIVEVKKSKSITGINFKMNKNHHIKGQIRDDNGKIPEFSKNELGMILYDEKGNYFFSHSLLNIFGGFGFSIPDGKFKIEYISLIKEYSSTYYNSGKFFYDENSIIISIDSTYTNDNVYNFNLLPGNGVVKGNITDNYGNPVHYVYIAVYDTSGHLAGINMSGFDLTENENFEPSFFSISNLQEEYYYLRTFANLVEELFLKSKYRAYDDKWYPDIEIKYSKFSDIYNLYHTKIFQGNVFVQKIPDGAKLIEVKKDKPININIKLNISDASVKITKDKNKKSPNKFTLFQNHPNPFNLSTIIRYEVSKSCKVKLKIYNILGQLVKTLVNEEKLPGEYKVIWNGKNKNGRYVPSGVYIYRLEAGRYIGFKKMVLMK